MASLETWIGLRYLRAKKRNGFMSFITLVSIAGIALGVTALIVVLSVMNGFQKEIRGQLLNVAAHAEIGYFDSGEGDWQNLRRLVQDKKEVLGSAPFITDQALLANAGEVRGVQIRGILPSEEKNVVEYGNNMPAGSFDDLKAGEFDIILGEGLAQALDAQVGGKVTVITPEGNVTPAGVVPRLKQFNVVGIVKTGVFEVDNALAMTHLADAQVLYRMGEGVSGLRLKLAHPQEAPAFIANLIPKADQEKIWVRDWTFSNRSYFEAVELEKRMMFIILLLIIAVAAFNLVSSLVMAVTEKQADIAILRTLGLPPSGVMKIFMVQGAFAGFFGTLAGVVCGVLLGWNIGKIVAFFEGLFGVHLINSQIYFIDYLPSDVNMKDVALIAAISLLLAFAATLYPSWRAAKTQPAEALRYE
ncbi:lipoprotein-releasing ABC transporter permease subunit [Neisseria sp. ZJ106]|uniref:Lipoprotein-releasing ABC transporter permease subunit n=1 Tax=Neisseria lisongii TaxID=2912188 RepID=A0AAW5AG15_9NEIS|nr:lipoprotein-releasing ABC transporter permease subunit [Neisseria lisongii]MCF7520705.1 lipoprotein-releasing ABC transporter permease subunit [Neisseria lisongii]MCF7530025.1 lipoprotein-releasing ABC transporter permease subunit [Neisseria lisongii]WCL72352.1 lipoprotein-releasing ABC transporter permease subunit [Neisseria lisongii]